MLQLPRPQCTAAEVGRDALLFVLRQWPSGFEEALHVLPFPREQGFRGPQWVHAGDVFQRAVIADALCDAAAFAGDQLSEVVEQEIAYLMSRRRPSGWSYFPDLAELPPDADDLAQIMTLLVRNGRYDLLLAACEEPLQTLFTHGAHDDGSFETWIVPSPPRTDDERLQHEWIARAWGRGPDVDVVANLLHALTLYDRARFAARIEAGRRFLLDRQHADASWSASWYAGPYYPTFAALRVVESPRAVAFLRDTQQADGSWGDPLCTALALCALREAGTPHDDARDRAVDFLAATRESDGGWPAADWIRMDLGRAEGHVHTTLTYGSRTITAAYVLKATAMA
jgi:squalene-hopene/tetraprenyl-beta-curcumene cyclase